MTGVVSLEGKGRASMCDILRFLREVSWLAIMPPLKQGGFADQAADGGRADRPAKKGVIWRDFPSVTRKLMGLAALDNPPRGGGGGIRVEERERVWGEEERERERDVFGLCASVIQFDVARESSLPR